MIGLLSVAGLPESSSAGNDRCAVMIMSICSLIAALKGGASIDSHCSRVWVMIGKATWLSVAVSPWPGKCLADDDDPAVALVAGDLGGGELGGELGSRREGPRADDGVERVDVDVAVGREVGVDAHREQLAAGDRGGGARVGGAAAGAEGHRAGELRRRRPDAGDDALLLVGGDLAAGSAPCRLRERGPLQAVGQADDLVGVLHAVGPREVDDAAEVVLLHDLGRARDAVEREVAAVGRRRVLAVDVLDEELADLLLQRHPGHRRGDPPVLAGRRRGGARSCAARALPAAAPAAAAARPPAMTERRERSDMDMGASGRCEQYDAFCPSGWNLPTYRASATDSGDGPRGHRRADPALTSRASARTVCTVSISDTGLSSR